jgi:hypothetical protein
MTKLLHGVLFMLAAFAMALPAHAGKGGGTVPPTVERRAGNDNTVYVGINWNFGAADGATAVLGYRDAKVKTNSNVDGWKVEATFVLSGANMGFGELRAKYLRASATCRASSARLLRRAPGLPPERRCPGPYVNGNVDYLFSKGLLFSIGANTLDKLKKPKRRRPVRRDTA